MPYVVPGAGNINAGWNTANRLHRGVPYFSTPIVFATWDPASKNAAITLSGGNLVASSGANLVGARSTIGKTSGKWYWEVTSTVTSGSEFIGICDSGFDNTTFPGNFAKSFSVQAGGPGAINGFSHGAGFTTFNWTTGDVLGFAIDVTAGKLWVRKNGTWISNDPTGAEFVNGLAGTIYACCDPYSATFTANFGASAFASSVPAGFNAGLF